MDLQTELDNLKKQVEQSQDLLQSAAPIFRSRGFAVPPPLITTLKSVHDQIKKMKQIAITHDKEYQMMVQALQIPRLIDSDISQTKHNFLDFLCELMGAERGFWAEYDTGDAEWKVSLHYGEPIIPDTPREKEMLEHLQTRFSELRLPQAIDTMSLTPSLANLTTGIVNLIVKSVLLIPVLLDDEPIAMVYMEKRLNHGAWLKQDEPIVQRIGDQIAYATHIAQQLAEKPD